MSIAFVSEPARGHSEKLSPHVDKTDDIKPSETSQNSETSFVCLDKDELLDKLYDLHEENLLLNEQLKQYRSVVESLERKLDEFNNQQNNTHKQITNTLLKLLIQKKNQLQKEGSKGFFL